MKTITIALIDLELRKRINAKLAERDKEEDPMALVQIRAAINALDAFHSWVIQQDN